MTISATSNVTTYTGDGVTNSYSTVFKFYETDTINVTVNSVAQVEDTDYTVTGGDGAVGTIQFTSAPASSAAIVFERVEPYEQQTDFENFDGNPADVTEAQFDKTVMQIQQLDNRATRTLSVPAGSTNFDGEITLTGNEGKFLQLKSDGTGFEFSQTVDPGSLTVSSYMETLLDDTDKATARQTLGFDAMTASKYGALLIQNTDDDSIGYITSQGTSGQVLQSQGADALPTWATIATSNDYELVSTSTASSDTSLTITSGLTSAGFFYDIVFEMDPNADFNAFVLEASTDGGSTWLNASGTYTFHTTVVTSSASTYAGSESGSFGTTGGINLGGTPGGAAGEYTHGSIRLINPAGTSYAKAFLCQSVAIKTDGTTVNCSSNAFVNTTSAIDGLRFRDNSGAAFSGTWKLYRGAAS